jgi:glycyl-tRNA synthetase
VGVTERQALFGRTRELARQVAEAYVEQRQKAEFPWLSDHPTGGTEPQTASDDGKIVTGIGTFLLEVGTEELPPSDLESALAQLQISVPTLLEDLRLAYGKVRIEGTPRRLVIFVDDLAARQSDLSQKVKGPPADRAFDAEGNPTRAAMGFARSKGIEVEDLVVEEIDGGDYVVASVEEPGRPASEVLSAALPGLIAGIRFNKSMRWNESGVAFSRPIRWLLALHGSALVPFEYAGYTSGRETRGLRFESAERFIVGSVQDYVTRIEAQGIILDPETRKAVIQQQVETLAEGIAGRIPDDPDLLNEVTHLVEKPTAFRGAFDKSYLEFLPPEVLISVMKKHQRYFVVEDEQGSLLPYFIAVRNGGEAHLDVVADGNEQVILARFDDAEFFVKKDLQQPFEAFVDDLKTLTFQIKLGSFFEKTDRIVKLVKSLGEEMALTRSEMDVTERAAVLCKADLATHMVVEMTSLQGIMGRYYALNSGEDPAVAEAIFEHYLPRTAHDRLPTKKPGLVVGLADRLDSLMGLFSVGLAPTGTKDPYGQRRSALAICQNLIEWQQNFDLRWGLEQAGRGLAKHVIEENLETCLAFIQGRLRGMLLDLDYNYDVVDAILAVKGVDPYGSLLGVKALTAWVEREDWDQILPAYSRCVRITRDQQETFTVDEACFDTDSEKVLFQGIEKAERALATGDTVDGFLNVFLPLVPVINLFFDEVLVMVEDETVRHNRLALLQRVSALSDGVVDLSFLEGF